MSTKTETVRSGTLHDFIDGATVREARAALGTSLRFDPGLTSDPSLSGLLGRVVRPRIGLLPTGHFYYWDQYPGLKEAGMRMYAKLRGHLDPLGDVVACELVDTQEKAAAAGQFFRDQGIDLLLIFPFGYTPAMCMVPAVHGLDVPLRLINAHEDRSYDYANSDTSNYLHHEGPCCIPEYAAALLSMGRKFRVRSGPFSDNRLWNELRADCLGTAAARRFRELNCGLIGQTYTNMVDMPTDEHRILRATGKMLLRPEVEEIEAAYARVTPGQLDAMLAELRAMYDVDPTVTDNDMTVSAKLAVAYDEVIHRHDISSFGYFWWGERPLITELRSQSAVAVSRLTSLGRPGVTEGDVKTAMGMKFLDLLGAGGMFVEFFAFDYDENFVLMGHDGPSNINVAEGRPKLQHLETQHGKSGEGLGIDFDMRQGPVTLLNWTQFNSGEGFKLIYTIGEVVPGEVLRIGNPNCRVKVQKPLHQFMDDWCQQGPCHHVALGLGDRSGEVEAFAESMKFGCVRV